MKRSKKGYLGAFSETHRDQISPGTLSPKAINPSQGRECPIPVAANIRSILAFSKPQKYLPSGKISSAAELFPELLMEEDQLTCYGSFCVSASGQLVKDSLQLSGAPLFLGQVAAQSVKGIALSWNLNSCFQKYWSSANRFF
ncbi:hypothetical protein [Vasconcelosia minhoensis]|nr:hypothetical protein [Romeria gracilis]